LPLIQGDRVQLQQVVLNLIMNAIDAIKSMEGDRREIMIGTDNTDGLNVVVTVQDSGPGIDSAKLDRVFGAFYTTKVTGLGMGLSVCRSIIDSHGGKILVANAEDGGAVFRFALPIKVDQLQSRETAEPNDT
jgi:signal transduction histidine kinase